MPGGAEGVVADPSGDVGRLRPPLHHRAGVGSGVGGPRKFGRAAPDRPNQRPVAVSSDAGPIEVGMQVGFEVVLTGQVHRLAAFLTQPHPQAAVLHVHVLHPHGSGRANAGEGVDHQPDQRSIAQADGRAHVDGVEDRIMTASPRGTLTRIAGWSKVKVTDESVPSLGKSGSGLGRVILRASEAVASPVRPPSPVHGVRFATACTDNEPMVIRA